MIMHIATLEEIEVAFHQRDEKTTKDKAFANAHAANAEKCGSGWDGGPVLVWRIGGQFVYAAFNDSGDRVTAARRSPRYVATTSWAQIVLGTADSFDESAAQILADCVGK